MLKRKNTYVLGLVRWNEVSSIEAPRRIPFSNWYHSRPSLNTINSSFPPTSAINSFLLPRVFESLLPSNSILPFKKSINYKPISLNCTYKKDGPTTQHCKEVCDIKNLKLELKPILEEDSGVFERKSEIDEITDDQIQVAINSTYQHDINSKSPTSSPAIDKVVTHQNSESDETDQLSLKQSEQSTALKAVEEPNSSLNSAEAEMLRMGEVIDLAINASEALKLLDMGYHEKGMEILKEVARCNHAESNFNLGVIFERGLYGNQISMRKAIKYYVKATKLNYPASFYNLGLVYEQSVDKTERLKANTLFEKAAELGLFEAKKKLGLSLQPKKGDGYEIHGKCKMCQDIGWQESEDNNVTIPSSRPETCFTLARAYHFGTSGMPQDKKYALELYREAAMNGHKKSKRAYEELKSSLSTDPLKNKKTKDPYRNNLIGRVKKRAERKFSSKFIKEYYVRSNHKSQIFQSTSGSKSSSSYVEFDSHTHSTNGKRDSQNHQADCHMMTAV